MTTKALFFIIFYFCINIVISQPKAYWAKSYGDNDQQEARCIATDENNNVYFGGTYMNTMIFESDTLPSVKHKWGGCNMTSNLYITKVDKFGKYKWSVPGLSFSCASFAPLINDIQYSDGNIYATGYIGDTMIFKNQMLENNRCGCINGFVLKMDTFGNVIWFKKLGSTYSCIGEKIVTRKGSIYISGSFGVDASIDSKMLKTKNQQAFICKLNMNGTCQWLTKVNKDTSDYVTDWIGSIDMDNNSNLVLLGNYKDSIFFSNGAKYYDIQPRFRNSSYILKMDTFGTIKWIKAGKNYVNGVVDGMKITKSGLIYIYGDYFDSLRFENVKLDTTTQQFNYKSAIILLDSIGNLKWAKNISNTQSNQPLFTNLATINDSAVVTTSFIGTAKINGNTYTSISNSRDYLVLSYNNFGTIQWVNQFGGVNYDYPQDIAANNNNIYLAGVTMSNYMIDTCFIQNKGAMDALLVNFKYNAIEPNIKKDTTFIFDTICAGQTYLFNGLTITNSGQFKDTLASSRGNDSIIILNLVITPMPTVETTISGKTITAKQSGAIYKWINCSTGLEILNQTQQSYTSTYDNGLFMLKVKLGKCLDSSKCIPIISNNIISNNSIDDFTIFPNPSQDILYIKFSNLSTSKSIKIYNQVGQIKYAKSISSKKETEIDLKEFSSGVYYIEINGQAKKIVKM